MSTIAAIATPRGEGGIAIVRLSGESAVTILNQAFRPAGKNKALTPRALTYGRVVDGLGAPIDEAMAVVMPAPHSYTREDVAEIQCHGGVYAASRVLERVLSLGAKPAAPGEFTRRAFENGRISLDEAEAVMGVISARSDAALRASVRALEGGASAMIGACRERLTGLLAAIEAADDFPDEIDEQATARETAEAARDIAASLFRHIDERAARAVRDGVSVVLCGRPNVGKSSLMNALVGYDRSIVTDVPGTTRDTLTESMSLDGIRVELTDTAGQRLTPDAVERIGVQRAETAQRGGDIVILVLDASEPLRADDLRLLEGRDQRTITVLNKCDAACAESADIEADVRLSARTREGLDALISLLRARVGAEALDESLLTNERHIRCAREAADLIRASAEALDQGAPCDVAAVDLWEARRLLGEITGEDATEAVIDAVFASFCVGK